MEVPMFFAGAFVVLVFFLWRSRRDTGTGPETPTMGLPDDLRDKNGGMMSLPNRGRPWSGGN